MGKEESSHNKEEKSFANAGGYQIMRDTKQTHLSRNSDTSRKILIVKSPKSIQMPSANISSHNDSFLSDQVLEKLS